MTPAVRHATRRPRRALCLGLGLAGSLAGSLLAAGCSSSEDAPDAMESDPAMAGALSDQIMVDPEMTGEQGSAVDVESRAITLPVEDRSPEAVADAKARAAKLAGGTLKPAPSPGQGGTNELTESVATAAQVAAASKAARTDCAAKAEYSNTWAAKLPAELPVYPRGAVQEAAGTDADGCSLRVVNFATPVSPADVVSFYYTKASGAGYGAQYSLDGGDHVIGGRKGGKAYVVYVRKLAEGVTGVDLVTAGK